jgi:hypothetical protein
MMVSGICALDFRLEWFNAFSVMPSEGGAPSNPCAARAVLPCLNRRFVITGSPAFAGDDTSEHGRGR